MIPCITDARTDSYVCIKTNKKKTYVCMYVCMATNGGYSYISQIYVCNYVYILNSCMFVRALLNSSIFILSSLPLLKTKQHVYNRRYTALSLVGG